MKALISMSPVVVALAAATLCARTFRSVVFPDPLGPIMASISPARTKTDDPVRKDTGSPVLWS